MSTVRRSYEDFQPSSHWVREAESDTLVVDLPGFKKEDLKVQLDNSGILMLSGEHRLSGNKWRRFRTEALVPEHCSVEEIRAKFENGALHVTMPKTITREDPSEQASPPKESPRTATPKSAIGTPFLDGVDNETVGGIGLVMEVNQSRNLMVNVIVAFLVVVALGIYVQYKFFRTPNKAEK